MFEIKLADGRWIEVTENIFMNWLGNKKTKNHCAHVEDYWNEMYRRADEKYYSQIMSY